LFVYVRRQGIAHRFRHDEPYSFSLYSLTRSASGFVVRVREK
jgi:hypothetical protein